MARPFQTHNCAEMGDFCYSASVSSPPSIQIKQLTSLRRIHCDRSHMNRVAIERSLHCNIVSFMSRSFVLRFEHIHFLIVRVVKRQLRSLILYAPLGAFAPAALASFAPHLSLVTIPDHVPLFAASCPAIERPPMRRIPAAHSIRRFNIITPLLDISSSNVVTLSLVFGFVQHSEIVHSVLFLHGLRIAVGD